MQLGKIKLYLVLGLVKIQHRSHTDNDNFLLTTNLTNVNKI